jgi:tRNA (mo5U34)-methyltransferase
MDFLERIYTPHREKIRILGKQFTILLHSRKKGVLRFREPYETVCHLRTGFFDPTGDTVCIGRQDELHGSEWEKVYQCLRAFMPWRKGPFRVFGIDIDAEWRSERKWNRLLPEMPELTDRVVADIGCNNGYYMFRMARYRPKIVIGFEPYLQHHFAFKTLNSFAGQDNLVSELLGVEHLALFPACFDVIFLMGILYHHVSPVGVLRDAYKALRPAGTLLVESQAIPGDSPVALFPAERYAKVPGTYFIPTGPCLVNWLQRVGFTEVKLFASHPMNNREQRRTDWMVFESYDDFIDPNNPQLTIEGYPAPMRVYLKAVKN